MTSSSGNVSIGGASPSSEPHRLDPTSKTMGETETPEPAPAGVGDDAVQYGEEGTNKTLPIPKPDNAPSDQSGHTRHIPKSPYTRG